MSSFKKNIVEDVWSAVESSENSWDSTQSDFTDHVSSEITKCVDITLKNLKIGSTQILFKHDSKKKINIINKSTYRKMSLIIYRKYKMRKITKDLIKFYNDHGYLTSDNQHRFLESSIKINRRWLCKNLNREDLANIKKYSHTRKYLLDLVIICNNYLLRRRIINNNIFNKCKNIINKLDKDYYNKYIELDVEDGIDVGIDAMDYEEDLGSCHRRIRVKIFDDYKQMDSHRVYRETTIPERDIGLLAKLHIILKRFKELRKPKQFRDEIELDILDNIPSTSSQNIQPEMLEPEEPTQQQSSGPVVLNALQQDKADVTVVEDNDAFWIDNSTSDQVVNVKHASSMEVMAKQFKWSSDSVSGFNIFNMDLPFEVLNNNPNHPASMLFNQYSYWNGGINVRIHINNTPFHVGKLIFSWYYSQKFDLNNQSRNNIASSVLLPHVCYDASVGDDVTFHIPFKNYRSMLCTKKKQFDSLYMYLGTLRCHVFNPLVLSTGTVVDGYVHVSFVDNNFTGISPRITIQPEMLSINSMVKTIEKTLTVVDKITNMDKPSQVAPPIMYTPQFTDSFASGNGDVNNVHALRLNPTGLTQHPSGSSTSISETLISSYVNRWGLLRTLTWDTSMVTGRNMFRIPATPELAYNQYFQVSYVQDGQHVSAFVLPPLSVIAGINAYNRGSIEYKLEFINSRYHTGALVISFTPAQSQVSFEQALQSYNSTLDLGNVKSYIFRVPYINERPYNPRYNREISNNIDPLLAPTGEINIFLLNQLRAVTGTSEKVYINLYIRAGPDFEFAVPVSPLYTINMDVVNKNPHDFVHANVISQKIGLATWRYMDAIANKAVVGKYDGGDDSIMQMVNIKYYSVYAKDWPTGVDSSSIICNYIGSNGSVSPQRVPFRFEYCARFVVNGDKRSYDYVLFFQDQVHAIEYVTAHYRKVTNSNPYPDSPTIKEWLTSYPTQTAFYLTCSDTYVNWIGNAEQFRYKFVYSAMPQVEMDEVLVDPTTSTLASLNSGYRMFGEQFRDLKDYCRRYQPYASFTMTINKNVQAVVTRVPITPIGLDISNVNNSNLLPIIKEGLIPYILSSYRFYRGGLRFKIIVNNFNGTNEKAGNTVFYVQHKPDIIVSTRNVKSYNISNTSREALFQTGYAYSALSTSVNNSLTVEIPCYIPTNLLMLQKPNFDVLSEILHYNLGVLDIYTKRPSSSEIGDYMIDIHYSIADDMDMSCFVGLPPVTATSDPVQVNMDEFVKIQPEVDDEKPCTSKQAMEKLKNGATPQGGSASKEQENFFKRNISTPLKEKLNTYIAKKACQVSRETLQLEQSNEEDTLWKVMKDACKKFGSENKHIILSVVHCISTLLLHPDIPTLALTMITILGHIGLESYRYMKDFKIWLAKLFGYQIQAESEDAGDNKTETSPIDVAKKSIISSIVEMSASTFGVAKDMISNISMPNFSGALFTNIRLGAITVNACITMIRNLCEFVPKVFSWLGRVINPKKWYRWLFFNESKFIKNWVRDVEWILDPQNRIAVLSQVKYNYQIQLLVIIGRDLVSKNLKLSDQNNFRYITKINDQLNELYKEVAAINIGNGNIGVEPFCFCLHGKSQIGKTYITKELSAECLRKVNYTTDNEIFYTRPLTTKHWDGVQNEPVCIYDDFAQVKTDTSISDTIGEFILLKSKATFTPPRAHLQDKGRKYSPLIVALTMNESHPKFDSVFACNDAWQNRRDVLVHVEFVPPKDYPLATKVQDLPEESLGEFKHVKFSIHEHVSSGTNNDVDLKKRISVPKEEDGNFVVVDGIMMMEELIYVSIGQIKWYLSNMFAQKYAKMRVEFLKDLKLATSFNPRIDETFEVNLKDYVQFVKNNRKMLNSREMETIKLAEKMTSHVVCDKCKLSSDCYCDLNVFDVRYLTNKVQAEGANEDIMELMEKTKKNNQITKDCYFDLLGSLKNLVKLRYPKVSSFFSNLVLEHEYFLSKLESQIKTGIISDLMLEFINKPCIHLWLLIKHNFAHFSIDVDTDNKSFWLLYHGAEASIDTYGTCCGNSEVFRQNKKLYYKKIIALYSEHEREIPLPIEFTQGKVSKDYTVCYSERYMASLQKNRDAFFERIDIDIKPSTWLGKVGSLITNISKPLLYILGIVIGVYGLYKGYKVYTDYTDKTKLVREYMNNRKIIDADALKKHIITDDCVEGNCEFCSVSPQMAYNGKKARRERKQNEPTAKQAEMAMDMQRSLNNSLRRNYFFIVAITPQNTETICRCLGIKNWSFICIDHYIDKINSLPLNTRVEIRYSNFVKNISLSDIVFKKLKSSALIIGTLPRTFVQFKDISTKFASSTVIPNMHKTADLYVLDLPFEGHKIGEYNVQWHKNLVSLHADSLAVPSILDPYNFENSTYVDYYWSYQTSGKGLCGSVLVSDMNISSPLIGIHIAGDVTGGRGYAEVVCRETLENVLETVEYQINDIEIEGQMFDDIYIPLNKDVTSVKAALHGSFNFIGTVPKKYSYNPPVSSKNVHSLCYDQITKSTYDYPHLSHRDPRFEGSPMINGCQHHVNPVLEFRDEEFNIAKQVIEEFILAKVLPQRQIVGKLSLEHSVCGIATIPGYDAMEFSTSEGFPFTSIRPLNAHDKKWLFDLTEDEQGYHLVDINSKLKSVMDFKHQQRIQGIVPLTIFTDCLKDLKLPKEKCHKTRIFSISPVDFTIQFRQYFYDFTISFQNTLLNVESAVGINVDSYEWHDMVQSLLNNSQHFVCGDYSKFGPRLMSKCVLAAFDIIINWYIVNGDVSEENALVREIMARETAFSKHLMLNMVYEVVCGAPSGCPITTILNNIVNMLYIRMAYLTIIRENKNLNLDIPTSLSSFSDYVCVFFYGDDLIMTVKEEILDFFNAQSISKFFEKFDIVFTDALKTGEMSLSTHVFAKETSFLKRNIKRHPYRPCYVAAMDKRAIEETCNWVFLGHPEPEASIISCESMLLNAFGHGPEYYDSLRSKVILFWRNLNIYPRIPLWIEVDWRIYEGI